MKGCLTCVENVCVDQCYARFLVVQLRHLCQGISFGILADTILREAYETIPDGAQRPICFRRVTDVCQSFFLFVPVHQT